MTKTLRLECLNFPNLKTAQNIKKDLQSIVSAIREHLVCCYLEDDDVQNRIILRQLINSNSKNHYVLISK